LGEVLHNEASVMETFGTAVGPGRERGSLPPAYQQGPGPDQT
jgi:hypothetical protein